MAQLPPEIEDYLAGLPDGELDALFSRIRPPEQSPDPKIRAAAALRSHRAGTTITRVANRDSSGRGRITAGAAPSDRGNAVATLRGSGLTYSDDD